MEQLIIPEGTQFAGKLRSYENTCEHEPQELRCIDDGEESKSSGEQCTDVSMVDKQPQSLILHESPLQEQVRALQSHLAHLQIENEGLRRQIDRERREGQRLPAELKWLIYFRAPASKA